MKTLAILDNEKSILTIFSLMLERKGYRVFTAEDIESCRSILDSEMVDVLISEYRLPAQSTAEFVRTLKKDSKFKRLPVIFLSGYGTQDVIKSALRSGGSEFLHKPCRIDAICETIERVAGSPDKQLTGI